MMIDNQSYTNIINIIKIMLTRDEMLVNYQ